MSDKTPKKINKELLKYFKRKVIKENKNARNPLTGKKIAVKEKKSIYFKMSKELRKKINENRVLN